MTHLLLFFNVATRNHVISSLPDWTWPLPLCSLSTAWEVHQEQENNVLSTHFVYQFLKVNTYKLYHENECILWSDLAAGFLTSSIHHWSLLTLCSLSLSLSCWYVLDFHQFWATKSLFKSFCAEHIVRGRSLYLQRSFNISISCHEHREATRQITLLKWKGEQYPFPWCPKLWEAWDMAHSMSVEGEFSNFETTIFITKCPSTVSWSVFPKGNPVI